MTNTNFKLGPFKFQATGLSTGLAVFLGLVFIIIAVAIYALLIWLLFVNIGILLVDFNLLNFVFAVLISLSLIGAVASNKSS